MVSAGCAQVFHCNPVLRLHVQGNYDKSSQESCMEALCVTYTDVLVRIGISDLKVVHPQELCGEGA
mgnify:FL=1